MNMSGGSFQVGRTDINPNYAGTPYDLSGRFQIGDRGKGILNMSGGTINVTRNVRVSERTAAARWQCHHDDGRHDYNRWAGNATLRRRPTQLYQTTDIASIILDGPTASSHTLEPVRRRQ